MQREFVAIHGDWPRQALFDKDKRQYWSEWQNKFANQSDSIGQFSFVPQEPEFINLPPLSFMLRVTFRLQKPYLSKDDRDFSLLDNPLRKEKVFQTPMVAATGWKGALRAALWHLGYKEDHETILRLFGNPRTSEEQLAGRLHCCPTFFSSIALEVINPHNRETGVGERPILMECVPAGVTGDFVVLYVPFGPIGQSDEKTRAEVSQDLEMLTEGIQAMLTIYGFGAKTSSGFGIAQDKLASRGLLALRAELPGLAGSTGSTSEPEQPTASLARYLESPTLLHGDLRQPDGSLKSEAEYQALVTSRGGQYRKSEKQLYDKARKWWDEQSRRMAEAQAAIPGPAPEPVQTPPVTRMEFDTLNKLRELAKGIATHLRNGDKA
jgi:CRISPR-associated protein Cmr2